jgi:hypothetical protein
VAEEFVDLYEVLEMPVDADRNTLRKRINELYLDAQRNLDHRNFATRVTFQKLFEVTLPQARYILLDDGRRDEYNRLVHAFRATQNGTAVPQNAPTSSPSAVAIDPDASLPGQDGPRIDAIPTAVADPEQLAREREELWKKWKSGLEEALAADGDERPKTRAATTATPTSFSTQTSSPATPAGEPQSLQAKVQPAPAAPKAAAPAPSKPAARPKVDISFDFGEKEAPAPAGAVVSARANNDEQQLSPAELDKRRTEHRRRIMKDLLVNVGLIWGSIGAAIAIIPGFALLVFAVGHFYPRNAPALLKFPSSIVWAVGLLIIGAAAFFISRTLSKNMRKKKAQELSFLTYEELLKQTGQG